MNTLDYLTLLAKDIHTVIIASNDENHHPVTCAIDIMKVDDNGLYFLTAKGKSFYQRLTANPYIALSGLKGESTMQRFSISIQGQVKEIHNQYLDEMIESNSYMKEIYPTVESRKALTVFHLYKGNGEYFDLSTKPITRDSFTIGDTSSTIRKYQISNNCIGCGACVATCPTQCIDTSNVPFTIQQQHCLHCGNCLSSCRHQAVVFN